jgi:hypothetical protein
MNLPRRLSEPGPILEYLNRLRAKQPDLVMRIEMDLKAMLQTDEGRMFLELLDKSVLLSALPAVTDERALVARNAQGLLALDLRRILSDESEQVYGTETGSSPAGRGRR